MLLLQNKTKVNVGYLDLLMCLDLECQKMIIEFSQDFFIP